MPIFAPAYRPSKHQQSYLARQQKYESRKRKRGEDSGDEGSSSEESGHEESIPRRATSTFHPVNLKDPYHIAGHPREEPLPPSPFPHAAVREPSRPKRPIEEELAKLNPPLYVPASGLEDKTTSLKRRHVDNLTTILHRCMLRGDWQRASRAWALLIRTEVAGRGIDVRRNGRWGIGAEVLMRRDVERQSQEADEEKQPSGGDESAEVEPSQFSEEGFRLAREYYERLILQHPYTAQTKSNITATVFYPALFNIWIYEVHDRSKRARRKLSSPDSSASGSRLSSASDTSLNTDQTAQLQQIRSKELEEALPIAQRMDEVLLGPPYDADPMLLQLRGMVALWTSDLHEEMAERSTNDNDESDDIDDSEIIQVRLEAELHRTGAQDSRRRAREVFVKVQALGVELPREALAFLSATDN